MRVERISSLSRQCEIWSILNRHRFRIHCFLACYAFKPSQYATIIVLIALHGEAAFLFAAFPIWYGPSQSDKVLL